MNKYAIFYGDGSIVEGGGEDDEMVDVVFKVPKKWLKAPNEDVQAVLEQNPITCRYMWQGEDYFYPVKEGTDFCHTSDMGAFLRTQMKGIIKFGACTTAENFTNIMRVINKYDRIPKVCERQKNPTKMD